MNTENIISLAVGGVSALVAVIAVIVAGIANSKANNANALASEANRIANDELEHQRRIAPPPWGQLEPVPGARRQFRVENKSGRPINVVELTALPADSASAVTFRQEPGSLVDYGDALIFSVDTSLAQDPLEISVAWVYSDRSEDEHPGGWEYMYRTLI